MAEKIQEILSSESMKEVRAIRDKLSARQSKMSKQEIWEEEKRAVEVFNVLMASKNGSSASSLFAD